MKEKILAFVSKLKDIFTKRVDAIPKNIYAHKRILGELEQEKKNLGAAFDIINLLDDSSQKQLASSLFYYLMEKVVPVITHWKARLQKIKDTHNTDIKGHIKAFSEYKEMKQQLYALVFEANSLNDEEFVEVLPDNAKNPGKAIIKSFNKERFLEKTIQTVEALSDTKEASLQKNCNI